MIGDTNRDRYGLYALRDFSSGDVLGHYMSKFVNNISNEDTSILLECKLNEFLEDDDTPYIYEFTFY